eukprot:6179403-Pleurochrysis_carterae.AAC.5
MTSPALPPANSPARPPAPFTPTLASCPSTGQSVAASAALRSSSASNWRRHACVVPTGQKHRASASYAHADSLGRLGSYTQKEPQ